MPPRWTIRARPTSTQLAFWSGLATSVLVLLYVARARAQWPWLSLWLVLLLTGLGVLSLPRVRRSLNLSWFGVTLLTLTGVSLANLFLVYVERHRQRSERLEVRGAYVAADNSEFEMGVGIRGLDVYLEGDPYAFERWSVRVALGPADSFSITAARNVDMLRTRKAPLLGVGSGQRVPRVGRLLVGGAPLPMGPGGEAGELNLLWQGPRGVLEWHGARAPLSLDDPLLDRRLDARLRSGVRLSGLDWDSLPDRDVAEDLVLSLTTPARRVGKLTLSLPRYRVVSRHDPWMGPDGLTVARTDTIWVTSRGNSWAFALDRVPEISRVAAPPAVMFVRRPRPTGWALPSAESCGAAVDRCAILSTGRLPPPQAHFDLGAFGLDSDRYSLTARLETNRNEVRVVTPEESFAFAYGETRPVPVPALDERAPDAGLLLRVHRADVARQGAVVLTVLGLYGLIVSALLVLLGNAHLAARLRQDSANTSAAWALLNVFLLFLGLRLALGLRVAYAPPFYDRAAATSVGLWISFGVMLIALGRWRTWTPLVWSVVARLERPIVRLLLPGQVAALPSTSVAPSKLDPPDPSRVGRGRLLARVGAVGFVVILAGLVYQRPEAGLGVLVAAVGLGAWLTMGLFGHYRALPAGERQPVDVLTTDMDRPRPWRNFLTAAGAAVVLALAIQAPIVALGPVVAGLAVYGLGFSLERSAALGSATARARGLFVIVGLLSILVLWVFVGYRPWILAGWAALVGSSAWALGRRVEAQDPDDPTRLLTAYQTLLEFGRSVFSGIGWLWVVVVLGTLAFLSVQDIPPFVRFALVFMLFLLAVRAGLVCRGVLDEGQPRADVAALGLLVIPVGVLLVFMLFDFGLGLVFFLPMMLTVLLAARIDRLPVTLRLGSTFILVVVVASAWTVLRPSVADLRETSTPAEFSERFAGLGGGFVDLLRQAGFEAPATRAAVRSVAASDPELLEEALAFAGRSEALFAAAPSLEQVWGGRAYAASGWTGTGLAGTTTMGRGVPTVVSYAENTFSVYVLSEHGAVGGLTVLLLYLSLLIVVGIWVVRVRNHVCETPSGLAVLAITVGSVLWLVLPAAYVAASNLGLIPLTGQNMPFLGLNSWADVVLVSGIATGAFIGLAGLNGKETASP
jgi:hypothetical protein